MGGKWAKGEDGLGRRGKAEGNTVERPLAKATSRSSFVALPPFIRVEPVTASGPTTIKGGEPMSSKKKCVIENAWRATWVEQQMARDHFLSKLIPERAVQLKCHLPESFVPTLYGGVSRQVH